MHPAYDFLQNTYMYLLSPNTYEHMQHYIHSLKKANIKNYLLSQRKQKDYVKFTKVEKDAKQAFLDIFHATHHNP